MPKRNMQNEDVRSPIQVISRAAALFRALEQHGARMSLGELAEATHLPRSTVQRIVSALAAEQLLDVDLAGKGVALGGALGRLANARRVDVRQSLRPYLERVAAEVKETVDLSLIQEQHVVFVDQVLSSDRLRVVSAIGSAFPIVNTAPGKILLASFSSPELERWARESKEARALKARRRLAPLLKEVEKAREDGFAYDLDQHTIGISAVAISIELRDAPAHAISVPVPSARFTKKLSALQASLREIKQAVTRRLIDPAHD